MKRKSVIALMLAGCLLFTAGCGGDKKKEKGLSNDYVKISQYKGVEVEKAEVPEVTDEEIENSIQAVLSEQTKDVTDRPLKEGDIAEVTYTGKLKSTGEVFDEGTLSLGNGETYVDGSEEPIYGHNLNETFDVNVTFPEGYGGADKPELSNAEVVFTVTINSIKEKVNQELTDEVVQKISKKSKTVKEYREEVRKNLEKSNKQSAESTMMNDVWTEIMGNAEVVKYPEDELKKAKEQMDKQMKMIMEQAYGLSFEDYLEQTGTKEEDYNKQITEMAKEYVKQMLVVDAIAEEENLEFSDKEYDKEIQKFSKENGYKSSEELLQSWGEEQVKDSILQNEVLEWALDHCKLVEEKQEDTSKTEEK